MDKIHLKTLIREVIKIVETEASSDVRDTYLYNKLFPSIFMRGEGRVIEDEHSGTLSISPVGVGIMFNNKSWPYVHATPFWEDSEGIPISVGDGDDYSDTNVVLPYKLTYNLNVDVANYFKAVYGWIENNSVKLKAHQHFKN